MTPEINKPGSRIAIVGAGQVGGAVAYALIPTSGASELLLVDTKVDLRDGQVQDLSDVAYSSKSRTRVRAATYSEASQCDIVIITAASRHPLGKRKWNERKHNRLPFCRSRKTRAHRPLQAKL